MYPESFEGCLTPKLGSTGRACPAYYLHSMPCARRFPPPWTVEETDACFIVRDANGQALAYGYFARKLF